MLMTSTRGIKLDSEIIQRLETLAGVRDRTLHWLMKNAIELYLEREENYEREKAEDLHRWEQYQLTGHSISHDKATSWLKNLSQGKDKPCLK